MSDAVREFWDAQAAPGATGGTRDHIAEELERRYLLRHVPPENPLMPPATWHAGRVLDAGCGLGTTLRAVLDATHARGVGCDFSPAMLARARAQHGEGALWGGGRVSWREHDLLTSIPETWGRFDVIYTQRALINLPSWAVQRQAIHHLADALAPGGRLILLENSGAALARLNRLRAAVGLEDITVPWHNVYVGEINMADALCERRDMTLTRIVYRSDDYYFLSRVVQAAVARAEGRAPVYDHPINQLALALPPHMLRMHCGIGVAWHFVRSGQGDA